MKERSKLLVEKVVAVVQQDPQNIDYEIFNKSVQSRYICPVSVDTITKRLGDSLATREVWLRLMRYKSIADKYGA